jgi:hypothetical protein
MAELDRVPHRAPPAQRSGEAAQPVDIETKVRRQLPQHGGAPAGEGLAPQQAVEGGVDLDRREALGAEGEPALLRHAGIEGTAPARLAPAAGADEGARAGVGAHRFSRRSCRR